MPESLGLQNSRQAAVAIGIVADEIDLGDLGALAFVDDEGQVDTAFSDRNDLGRHFDVAAADVGIGFADALDVGIDEAVAIGTDGLRLHEATQLVVLDLAVAVEHDLIDRAGSRSRSTTSVPPETEMRTSEKKPVA